MRTTAAACVVLSTVVCTAPGARADQPRDYMFDREPAGDFLVVDYFGSGAQLSLEHREPLYPPANDWKVGVSSLLGYPFGQLVAHAGLRMLFLDLGVSAGYRALWRNLSFAPGSAGEYCSRCDRAQRRAQDDLLAGGPGTDGFGFLETRALVYLPWNRYVMGTTLFGARYEDCKPRSFDWIYSDIHDAGVLARWESLLFVKHRDLGGIGPYFQLLFLPRAGRHETAAAVGFNAVTRLGLVDRDDLLFFTFLMRPADRYFGQHTYYAPVRALLVYRMTLAL